LSVRLSSRTDVRVDEPVVELVVTTRREHPDPGAADTGTAAPAPERAPRRRPRWLVPLGIYALSRVVVLVSVLPGAFRHFTVKQEPWPFEPAGSGLLHVLGRWDAAWYLMIAHRGYPGSRLLRAHLSDVAFFPLHPMLLRGLTDVTRLPSLVAGELLVAGLGAVAALLVWRLADRLGGPVVAQRAVLLFCFFPGAFSLSFIYAEPLMIVGLAGCLVALVERRWILAGLAGAIATASRPNACVILLACAWAAAGAIRRDRDWRSLAAPGLAASGIGGYFLYLWAHSGDLGAWFRSERVMWHDHMSPTAIVSYFRQVLNHPPSLHSAGLDGLVLMLGLVFIAAALLGLRRVAWPRPLVAYTVAALLLPLTSVAVGPRPRILMAAFPVAILAATRIRGRAFTAVVITSGVALGFASYLGATSLAMTP